MRPVRSALVALGAACLLVPTFAFVTTAGAGNNPYIINLATTCNTATAQYNVTATFNSNYGEDLDFTDLTYYFEFPETTVPGEIADFTLPADGTFIVTYSVPGTATYTDLSWTDSAFGGNAEPADDMAGTCVADAAVPPLPIDPTPAPGPVPADPSTPPAVQAVAATPSFTG